MALAQSARPLRIAEAARHLGVHPTTLRRAEREGRLPRTRREEVSGYRVYTTGDIEILRERLFGRI